MSNSNDGAESVGGNQYVDVRDLMPNFEWQECWNCGNEKRIRTDTPGHWICCRECFMGQRKVPEERRGEYETEDGYTDYRRLWYGDVSIEQAKRKHERVVNTAKQRSKKIRSRDRTVRL